MNAAPLLRATDLLFTVPGRVDPIVNQVDLDLNPGELVGLIGSNGAGKSTLMRLLLGYLPAQKGHVEVTGDRLKTLSSRERARRLSYMGQQRPLSFPFTAVEVVEMGAFPVLGMGRSPGHAERRAAMEALHYVDMAHAAERNFLTLSGGEQQLVLFAQVLVQDTPVILLDEPTANLDLGHEAQLLRMARELCSEGRAVLTAMHNLNSAAEYCDRLILLHNGRITAQGTPGEVLTASRIEAHYHTPVRIGTNESTGSITVTPAAQAPSLRRGSVHIIGGAGSAVTLTRHLHLLGFEITGGIAHEMDNDARLWQALGIPFVEVPAFAEIDDQSLQQAAGMVRQAEITILCSFPFGRGNLRNLELAEVGLEKSGALFILSSKDSICRRDFYAPGSRESFLRLVRGNPEISYEQLIEMIHAMTQKDTERANGGTGSER
ncbi:MAG: ABC transporter ATP-binding protein [Spirochaeta sp.]